MVTACDAKVQDDGVSLRTQNAEIINGTEVTGNDHMNVVSLTAYGQSMCTGTLITPNFVLTAAHCIDPDDYQVKQYRDDLQIGFGQKVWDLDYVYDIDEFYMHPDYSEYEMENDIALIKLKKPVPESVAKPAVAMPPSLGLKASDIDGKGGVKVNLVGFGSQDIYGWGDGGEKYETNLNIYAICPITGSFSRNCTSDWMEEYGGAVEGVLYLDETQTGSCFGDSGGPAFYWRNGVQYVIGVTSFGVTSICNELAGYTIVSDFYDFLEEHVTDLHASVPEDCSNGIDDNGNNLTDCDDPQCAEALVCQPEICDDGIDNNGDRKVDCDDPQCAEAVNCQPEICNDNIDNNGDDKTDCDDPQCAEALNCQPEICDDGIDNNGNDKTDCDDPQCANALNCQPEICDDGIDNNDNDKIDCDDPQCAEALNCQPEICNDGIDNNADDKTDCDDPQCAGAVVCQPEICDDDIDNNGDNKIDCDDPQCTNASACLPEICDNGIDDNGDRKVDCDDPQCTSSSACLPEICDNGIDDNGNNKIDCDDPQCASAAGCQAAPPCPEGQSCGNEICNNGIDDNGDNRIDCHDPLCASDSSCATNHNGGNSSEETSNAGKKRFEKPHAKSPSESCSATPQNAPDFGAGILAMLGLLGLGIRRRLGRSR